MTGSVRAWVREDFGIDLVSLAATGHGADDNADLWRGAVADGTAYAVKRSGGGTPAGLVVSAHLAARGVAGVAGPLPTRDGRLWTTRESRRLSIVPWVSDDRALSGELDAPQWTAYGALLASVHAASVTGELSRLLPREDQSPDRVASAARTVDARLRDPAVEDDLVRALTDEWRHAAGPVSTLLDRADALGRALRSREAPYVVCHGDPHLGNVLLGKGDQIWLIDWDDALLAPREFDLMFVVGGVLAFAPVGPREQAWFFDGYGPAAGYGPADLDPTRLAYYLSVRALVDIVDFAAYVLDVDERGAPERAQALSIVRGLLSPTGLVTLALTALRNLP